MNKAELIDEVILYTGLTKAESRKAVNAIVLVITDSLARGEKITLVGFGTFRVGRRKARTGRNPQTGQTIEIPAKGVPKFSSGKTLREAIT